MSTPKLPRFLPTAGTCATCGDVLVAEGENGALTHASEENCPTQAPAKSYRSVPMCPPDAMSSAAYYLTREWSRGQLGCVGTWRDSFDRTWYIFQCRASDGSRWLIRADAYGNTGTFEASLEREIAAALDVEVSA